VTLNQNGKGELQIMKKKNWFTEHPLFSAIIIFIVVLLMMVLLIVLIWGSLLLLECNESFWVIAGSVATLVAAAGVFGAGYIAYGELSEIAQSRYLDVADRLFDALNSEESIEARRWIFQNLENPLDYDDANFSEAQRYIKHTLNTLDRVAFVTKFGYVSNNEILPWMHPMIIKSWIKLQPIVLAEREKRNEPLYYKEAEKLALRTINWCENNEISINIRWDNKTL
jgi:ABC-type multidrug transport system fused ATPase/permease subunit